MNRMKNFFWLCSGADQNILQQCPSESSKYAGIGATVFFTGLFAALAGGYALWTVFDNVYAAIGFGLVWGLLIFNLDRYIVSSMRKEGNFKREILFALPRIILAMLISVVIAKPLELKIFEKEINPELVMMEQEMYERQDKQLRSRFTNTQDSISHAIQILKGEIVAKTSRRDELAKLAQEEADGTGGSKKRNPGPIYKIKKADADRTDEELKQLTLANGLRIKKLERSFQLNDSLIHAGQSALVRSKIDGPAARMEALSRVIASSNAILWAHYFIVMLFMAIEMAPVLVKLISSKGPYDNLLRMEEHNFAAREIEHLATVNSNVKQSAEQLKETERNFVSQKLDASLK